MQRPRREVLRLLTPHLRRSKRLQSVSAEKESKISALIEAEDRLPFGVAFMGPSGRMLQGSKVMSGILASADGLLYTRRRLRARIGAEDDQLQRALLQTLGSRDPRHCGGSSLVITRGGGRKPLTVTVIPLPMHQDSQPRMQSLLVVHDPEQAVVAPLVRVMRGLALTLSEGRLALLIAQGISVRKAAEVLQVSQNNCKSQLTSIYRKTQCRNRIDLSRTIADLGQLKDA